MTVRKIEVDGYDSRGGAEQPFGYIDFTDGMRIGYAPDTDVDDVREDGLFICRQAYAMGGKELTERHIRVAAAYVKETLAPALAKIAEQEAAAPEENSSG